MHIARKYNGEWLPSDGSMPMILDGWQAYARESIYRGMLVRGNQLVISDRYGNRGSQLSRDE
ncbi:MAG: hypothetical protein WA110_02740 [Anaerolineaceae bacterium]